MYRSLLKPVLDVLVALLALIVLLPVFMAVMIILAIANTGTPFFTQLRPGLHGIIFKIIKFKTMNDKKDSNGFLLSDAERITKTGFSIRKTAFIKIIKLQNCI
jgi:lipopolysaccharide/colanic/teichoic acid biosynthesis glycosyltransferase